MAAEAGVNSGEAGDEIKMAARNTSIEEIDNDHLGELLTDGQGNALPESLPIVHQPLPSVEEMLPSDRKANIFVSRR